MAAHKRSAKQKIITGLGGAAYLLWATQWLWVCLLYMERFFQSPVGKLIKPDVVPAEPVVPPPASAGGFDLPEPLLVTIAVIGGMGLIIAAVYVVFRTYIPDVQRVARTAIQKTAAASTERAIRHHVVPAKKRGAITARVAFWLKVVMTLAPVGIVFTVQGSTSFIARETAQAGALLFALPALVLVLSQYALMSRWRLREPVENAPKRA